MSASEGRFPKKPAWLKVKFPSHAQYFFVDRLLREKRLHTICRSARCPNTGECWSEKTATFLILGDVCTRSCSFCAVNKGRPSADPDGEALRVAEAAEAMNLDYCVVTSVTRDDLPDGGASVFADVIRALRCTRPDIRVEVLVPDFAGNPEALQIVLDATPDVLNHNLEVPENIYPAIGRPAANYRRSLDLVAEAGRKGATTKSGLMVGLGEDLNDLTRTIRDLRRAGCKLLTIGQYLQPERGNVPVARFYPPTEFEGIKAEALGLGFQAVEAGPLVRSSYRARRMFSSTAERGD